MRVLHISPLYAQPVDGLPTQAATTGFYWVSCTRSELEAQLPAIQTMLTRLGGSALVDLHVSDLLNPAIPSNYDYTSVYDVLVFRRLANAHLPPLNGNHASPATAVAAPPGLPARHRQCGIQRPAAIPQPGPQRPARSAGAATRGNPARGLCAV
jgi:hypothetical protein